MGNFVTIGDTLYEYHTRQPLKSLITYNEKKKSYKRNKTALDLKLIEYVITDIKWNDSDNAYDIYAVRQTDEKQFCFLSTEINIVHFDSWSYARDGFAFSRNDEPKIRAKFEELVSARIDSKNK